MMDKLKKYILALTLFSAVAFGILYLYDEYFSPEAKLYRYYSYSIYEPELLPQVKLLGKHESKYKPEDYNKIIDDLDKRELPTENSSHSSGSSMSNKNRSSGTYTSHRTTGSLPHGSGGNGSGSIAMSTLGKNSPSSSSMSSSQTMQNPIAAPYHKNNNGSDNIILADPGGDPEERNRIPVGNGLPIFALLTAVYSAYIVLRKRRLS